jgi:6-phospho-beta-glucosidase
MKIAVIGGGSTYTPELVNGFLERVVEFPLRELWLMDIDAARLEIVGEFAQRMVAAKSAPFTVHLTNQLADAVAGASYVVTQLRVGQMAARREDEYLGLRHGLIGQETTGVGGMANALRTIPVLLEIAQQVQTHAEPDALLVNFTNPAGLITQALHQYAPEINTVGVCNVPITAKMQLLELVEEYSGEKLDPGQVELDTLGLNHLSWHRGLRVAGEDLWAELFPRIVERERSNPEAEWDVETLSVLCMLPNYYLQYFYYTDRKLAEQAEWPPSRAETVMEIEADLLKQYADPRLNEPPLELMQRGGAYYSTMATQLLNAHYNDLAETHVVNIPHYGAVAGWPAVWVLEMPARVSRSGIEPLPTEVLPQVCYGLIAQVKSYELLTVDAAVTGDRQVAYQALLTHPLGPPADRVQEVLEDMLATNRAYLPRFWAESE